MFVLGYVFDRRYQSFPKLLVLYCHVDGGEGKVTKSFPVPLHFGPNVFGAATEERESEVKQSP